MRRCFQLAQQGLPAARPNPLVGSVIVYGNSIIGEGFHAIYGSHHAEVNAVNSVQDPSLLKDSTIYVNLEPCAHFGKTPPCADLIIKYQIPRVVISCVDTFSEVAGKGIERLKGAGVEVTTGVLEKEGRELNKRFFTFHEKKRPYIVLKWAQTLDGFMDIIREKGETGPKWITNFQTRQLVHQWRSEEMAILVGHQTWITDHPSLNVREVDGPDPLRIIWSNDKSTSGIMDRDLLFSGDLSKLMHHCVENNIQSILVEGGRKTIQRFLDKGIWDEARVLTGNAHFGNGLPAPKIASVPFESYFLPGKDLLTVYKAV